MTDGARIELNWNLGGELWREHSQRVRLPQYVFGSKMTSRTRNLDFLLRNRVVGTIFGANPVGNRQTLPGHRVPHLTLSLEPAPVTLSPI